MKKVCYFVTIILLALFIVGCDNEAEKKPEPKQEYTDELYEISDDKLSFIVNFDYHQGTNYRWYYEIDLDDVLQSSNEKYTPIITDADILGGPGKYNLTFTALNSLDSNKKVNLKFTYNTPNKTEKHPKTYEFNLYVKTDGSISVLNSNSYNLNGPDESEHAWKHYDYLEAICGMDGHSAYDECAVCGKRIGYENIPAILGEHDFKLTSQSSVVTKEAPIHTEYTCEKCGVTKGEYENVLNRSKADMDDLNILLIGNSYTNYNTMMNALKGVIENEGIKVNIVKVSYGSQYLYDYVEGPQGDYYKQVKDAVAKKDFDIVFLQDQSTNPAENPANFYDNVRKLYDFFTNLGTTCILYETWTRKGGYSSRGWSEYEMAERLCASYTAIGEELGIKVSHCGTAVYDLLVNHKDIPTHNDDNSHPSTYTSYVVALCHYASIYGRSPIGINYKYNDYIKDTSIIWHASNERVEVTDDVQAILEQVAYDAIYGDSMLDDNYRTSSIGVSEGYIIK